jgi:prepilin-type processing-associated H-X9-DG protein
MHKYRHTQYACNCVHIVYTNECTLVKRTDNEMMMIGSEGRVGRWQRRCREGRPRWGHGEGVGVVQSTCAAYTVLRGCPRASYYRITHRRTVLRMRALRTSWLPGVELFSWSGAFLCRHRGGVNFWMADKALSSHVGYWRFQSARGLSLSQMLATSSCTVHA